MSSQFFCLNKYKYMILKIFLKFHRPIKMNKLLNRKLLQKIQFVFWIIGSLSFTHILASLSCINLTSF